MDTRRRLTPAVALGAGALLLVPAALPAASGPAPLFQTPPGSAEPERGDRSPTERAYAEVVAAEGPVGRPAIAAANAAARTPSRADAFVGGVQVFDWAPGRVYEVWTAPLRVTTLSLSPGETILTKAAGDTVRWQIGEATSGSGAGLRTHLLLKPLRSGLETNLVLTTSHRVYLIALRSGPAHAFNSAVSWDDVSGSRPDPEPAAPPEPHPEPGRWGAEPMVEPDGPVDLGYRIEPTGRRPRWTPSAVFNDGRRTFIVLDPSAQAEEAPGLFAIGTSGEPELVNYRQRGGLLVVDRVLDQAELRLGDRQSQVVRLRRLSGERP